MILRYLTHLQDDLSWSTEQNTVKCFFSSISSTKLYKNGNSYLIKYIHTYVYIKYALILLIVIVTYKLITAKFPILLVLLSFISIPHRNTVQRLFKVVSH